MNVPHDVKGEVAWIFCVPKPGEHPERAGRCRAGREDPRQGVQAGARGLRRRAAEDALGEDRPPRRSCEGAREGSGRPVVARESRRARGHRACRLSSKGKSGSSRGGRGIGANVARELTAAGMRASPSRRERANRSRRWRRDRGLGLVADVSRRAGRRLDLRPGRTRALAYSICSSPTPGSRSPTRTSGRSTPERWWHVHEVNVLGVFLCCRAVIPQMLERWTGRIVIVASGAAYLPGAQSPRTTSSKAAVNWFAETLANQLKGRIPVFSISPGLGADGDDRGAPFPGRRP